MEEPGAGKPHAGICGGGAGYPAPLPDKALLPVQVLLLAKSVVEAPVKVFCVFQ